MTRRDVEPGAEDLRDLLDVETARGEPPADARARVRERVARTLGLAMGPGGTSASAPTSAAPTSSAGSGGGAAGALGAGSAAATTTAVLTGKGLAIGASILAIGTLGFFGIHAVTRGEDAGARRAPVAAEARGHEPVSAPAIPEAAPTGAARAPAAPAAPLSPPRPAAPRKTAVSETNGRDLGLAAERELLERARSTLAAGEGRGALGLLDDHARRFAGGRLAEERESLRIRALVVTGRHDAAREHGARFRRRYPGSLYQPVVDAALEAIP